MSVFAILTARAYKGFEPRPHTGFAHRARLVFRHILAGGRAVGFKHSPLERGYNPLKRFIALPHIIGFCLVIDGYYLIPRPIKDNIAVFFFHRRPWNVGLKFVMLGDSLKRLHVKWRKTFRPWRYRAISNRQAGVRNDQIFIKIDPLTEAIAGGARHPPWENAASGSGNGLETEQEANFSE